MRRLAFIAFAVSVVFVATCGLTACSHGLPALGDAPEAEVLLLGEQHDAPRHQQLHEETVRRLAQRGQLRALALEMAEQGGSTLGLAPSADEAAVRAALHWDDRAWPWPSYAPAVMAAVRAGVPVLGANLPRQDLRGAMADVGLDAALPAEALARQQEAVEAGHCGLLPAAQVPAMTRVQVARDQAMALTLATFAEPGRTVVLIAGNAHVDPQLGVPRYLPAGLRVRSIVWPAEAPQKDYCAELRQQMAPR